MILDDPIVATLEQVAASGTDICAEAYRRFEAASHRAYGVTPGMFPVLLACVRDALRNELGGAWTAAMETAWQQRIEDLSAEIESAAAG